MHLANVKTKSSQKIVKAYENCPTDLPGYGCFLIVKWRTSNLDSPPPLDPHPIDYTECSHIHGLAVLGLSTGAPGHMF